MVKYLSSIHFPGDHDRCGMVNETLFAFRSKSIILAILVVALLPTLYDSVPVEQDWVQFFRPVTLAMLHGQNPYSIQDFHNAPWTLIPFIPLALMPDKV